MGKQPNRGDGLTARRARRASGAAFGPILRLLAFSAVGCTAASAAIWMYPRETTTETAVAAAGETPRAAPARKPAPEPARPAQAQPPAVQVAAAQAGLTRSMSVATQPAGAGEATATRNAPPARADAATRPAPATAYAAVPTAPPPATAYAAVATAPAPAAPVAPDKSASAPAPQQPDPAGPAPAAVSKTPTDCLPAEFKALIRDLEARFGRVTLVSTTTLNTNNHGKGSTRHKLHTNCKAVDFKVAGDVSAVTQYLRTRPEVLGINAFGNNGVIHIDYNERRRSAARN